MGVTEPRRLEIAEILGIKTVCRAFATTLQRWIPAMGSLGGEGMNNQVVPSPLKENEPQQLHQSPKAAWDIETT